MEAIRRQGGMSMAIAFIDLQRQQQRLQPHLDARIHKMLIHGHYIHGPEVTELENTLAQYVGVKHCIGAASGTDALLVALLALGVGPDSEVITTPFTFISTVESILLLGAKPVFVDIDPTTYHLDPSLLEQAITSRTKAILAVSLYGQCCDFTAINEIAQAHNIPVIEDAAQSFGALYKYQRSCGLSTIAITSFYPAKPLGCYGDGGAIFTSDSKLAEQMREISNHGERQRYIHTSIGINSRLDTLQAGILLEKFKIFPEEVQAREAVAQRYAEVLPASILPPFVRPFCTSVYAQYTIQVPARDAVITFLRDRGVPTAVHYPVPLHLQPIFAERYQVGMFIQAEKAAQRVLSLPMHPYLSLKEQKYIALELSHALQMYCSESCA
jgi:UDP-2-acetamido-2-deoxy-ribo-hexuluronate aminotransferase